MEPGGENPAPAETNSASSVRPSTSVHWRASREAEQLNKNDNTTRAEYIGIFIDKKESLC
jgi:hypothetical protein